MQNKSEQTPNNKKLKLKKKSSVSIHESSHRRHNSVIDPTELMPPIGGKEEEITATTDPKTIETLEDLQLPKIHKSLSSDCPICFNLMIEPTTLTCKHHFCMQCIEQVIKTKTKCVCPLCRHPITKLDLKIDREVQRMIRFENKVIYKQGY